jgi:glucokinase
MAETGPVLGIDLGATNVRAAVGDETGTIHGSARGSTPQDPDGAVVARAVLDCALSACREADVEPPEIDGVGIASIGPLDRDAGVVVEPPNVPAERIELVAPLREAFEPKRTVLHNDAVAGAIGERWWAGAPEQFVYLTLSTGIGAGAVVDGRVLSGHRGNAAEIGHVTVDPEGRLTCGCGGPGHWEAYCSGSAIPRLAALLARTEGASTALPVATSDDEESGPEQPIPDQPFDAAAVFDHASADRTAADRAGDDRIEGNDASVDPLASRTLEEIGRLNALGVAATVHAFAPETIRIGGAVALENQRSVLDPIRDRLPRHLAVTAPTIEPARLGAEAVLRGALAAALGAP